MIFDFGGGKICPQCGDLFDFVPVETAEQLGGVPANSWLSPAVDVMPDEWKAGEPFWSGSGWPDSCPKCEPRGWLVPVVIPGASFFRS